MKRIILIIICIFALNSQLWAYEDGETQIYWSLGDVGFNFDIMSAELMPAFFLNVGNINWVTSSGFGWGFNFINMEISENGMDTLILPVEISYNPLMDKAGNLFLSFYGRGGWQVRHYDTEVEKPLSERSRFFGAAGMRFAWMPKIGNSWSLYNGAYIEYTTNRELRVGLSIDLAIVGLMWLYSN